MFERLRDYENEAMTLSRLHQFSVVTFFFSWTFALLAIPQNKPARPGTALDVVIANARTDGDKKAETRATNLKTALARMRPSDLNGVSCGNDVAKTSIPIEDGKDFIGDLLGKGLEKYLPTLAAALASAPSAGLVALLTPQKIGSDSIEIINNSKNYSHDDVSNAARQLLQDTVPESFNKLPRTTVARIVMCSF
jgi:hypothetical protein